MPLPIRNLPGVRLSTYVVCSTTSATKQLPSQTGTHGANRPGRTSSRPASPSEVGDDSSVKAPRTMVLERVIPILGCDVGVRDYNGESTLAKWFADVSH